MPNDPINQIETTQSSLEQIFSHKSLKLILVVIASILIGLIIWGAIQLQTVSWETTTEPVDILYESVLSKEVQIRQQLETLAAEDTSSGESLSEEETRTQLETLTTKEITSGESLSEEEILTQLEALVAD